MDIWDDLDELSFMILMNFPVIIVLFLVKRGLKFETLSISTLSSPIISSVLLTYILLKIYFLSEFVAKDVSFWDLGKFWGDN